MTEAAVVREPHPPQRSAWVHALLGALTAQGLPAVAGGLTLVADPTGSTLGLGFDTLRTSPFADYRLPGLLLTFVVGLPALIAGYGLWHGRRWAWYGALFSGVALAVWIAVEVMFIGLHLDPPLQLLYGTLGLVIVALALTGPVVRWAHAEHPADRNPGGA